jgi:fatty acid desaturase
VSSIETPASSETGPGSEFAALSRRVRQAGLLRRRRAWYAWRISGTAAALVAGWVLFVLAGDSWWQIAVAVLLAVVFAQLGFLGHDAGHRQIFATRRSNYALGVACGNLAIGLSYGWWVSKHNRHHAHPNTEGEDPDIMIGVLAFSRSRARAAAGLRRMIFRYQAYLLIPMLLLEGVSLHGSSIRALTRRRSTRAVRSRAAEASLLALHFAAYLSAVFLLLSPVKAVVFILVQQGLFGFYLGCSFAPNHKGMPVLAPGDKVGFLQRQVLTSRNVRGGWLTDNALGGLNHQIEHHLFPSMPRPSLRHARPLIKAFCTERGLPYAEASLLGSYAQALRYLNQVGRQTRWLTNDPATAAAPSGSLSPRRARRPGRPAPHCAG